MSTSEHDLKDPKNKENESQSNSDKINYYFVTLLAIYVFDRNLKKIHYEELPFVPEKWENIKREKIKNIKAKFDAIPAKGKILERILHVMQHQDFEKLRQRLMKLMEYKVSTSCTVDDIISTTISVIDDLQRIANILFSRLRDYNSSYFPELENYADNMENYAKYCLMPKKKVVKMLNITTDLGCDFDNTTIHEIQSLAKKLLLIIEEINKKKSFLEKIMLERYPNFSRVATPLIGARLIAHVGNSLKLALLPSSAIQILGAEKALFKHLTYGTPSPKYGIIYTHPVIQKANKKSRGRLARKLANEMVKAIRIDVFSKRSDSNVSVK